MIKKKVLSASVWQIGFWVATVLYSEALLEVYVLPKPFVDQYLSFIKSGIPTSPEWVLFGVIFALPTLYAVYQLSQTKKNK